MADGWIVKLVAILIIIVMWLVARVVIKRVFKKILLNDSRIQMKFARSIVQAIITVVMVGMIGMQIEVTRSLTSVMLQSSALLVAVAGFAAQQTLNDIISGLMISVCKPFNINERVNILSLNISGIVEDITIRHTIIKTFNNNRVIIPNSIMNKEILENNNFVDSRCGNYLEVTVDYNTDIEKATNIIKKIIQENELTIKLDDGETNKHEILVKDINGKNITLKTTVWTKNVDDNFKACSDIRLQIKEEFDRQNIKLY